LTRKLSRLCMSAASIKQSCLTQDEPGTNAEIETLVTTLMDNRRSKKS
jgi:hypothetical protein